MIRHARDAYRAFHACVGAALDLVPIGSRILVADTITQTLQRTLELHMDGDPARYRELEADAPFTLPDADPVVRTDRDLWPVYFTWERWRTREGLGENVFREFGVAEGHSISTGKIFRVPSAIDLPRSEIYRAPQVGFGSAPPMDEDDEDEVLLSDEEELPAVEPLDILRDTHRDVLQEVITAPS